MDKGRILILGQTKENTYEIRNLLDNKRFELEIALSKEVGKSVLSTRLMNLLILHSEILGEDCSDLFEFLEDRGIDIPVMILGEEATRFRESVPSGHQVVCVDKPYDPDALISYIRSL